MTKPLHGQLLRQSREVADSKSWAWLASGNLKKETEGFLMAAQDHVLRTNAGALGTTPESREKT